jgi:glycosyltransferase involved in cell wall biosynthesis
MKESAGRVLMLVENCYPRDTRVRNEARTLVQDGFKVTVIAIRGAGETLREVVNRVTVYRIPRLTLFEKLPDAESSRLKTLVNKLLIVVGYFTEYVYFTSACLFLSLYLAVKDGFDIVHAHNPPDTLFIVGAVHKVFGKKFVFDHHDLSPELYRSRFKTSGGLVAYGLQVLETLSLKLADVAIATNESYRAIDIQRSGIDPAKVFIVRNGPDLTRVRLIEPDRALKNMGKTILGYVGAMNPQDGVDHLLGALHHLAHDLKRNDFYCVLIGDGDSKEALKLQAAELGLSEHVLFTGFIPDEDMVRYLSTADVCLDPNPSSPLNDVSTWIKVMEYMALGKPVISFDLKETRTSAGDAALYVTPNNEAQFAKAIARLMDDPAKRREMGECGKTRVQNELGWHVTSLNLLSAYDRLVSSVPQQKPAPYPSPVQAKDVVGDLALIGPKPTIHPR